MSADEDITEKLLADGLKLSGLDLAMLGHEAHPDDLAPDERAQFEAEDLDEMAAMPEAERAVSLRQARLLAGLLWHSSVVMIDQLYADLATVSEMKEITAAEIDGTWVLSSLPARFAAGYDAAFVRRFIVVAADLTGTLVRRWESPGCVAAELALRCLLDQAEVTADTYELDLADGWRERLEDILLEDADSDMLYSRRLFEPFNTGYSVPPYARSA